jgi:CRISPR type III-A-associated RAMP protein Csm5
MSTAVISERKVKIELISAIHIGSGESYGPKDCVQRDQFVFIAHPDRLLAMAGQSPQKEQEFVTFCEDEHQGLREYLDRQRIPYERIAVYRVLASGKVARLIPAFIKTGGQHPYIPGSSLKGAVRSAILISQAISDGPVKARLVESVNRDLVTIKKEERPKLSRWRKTIGTNAERTFFGEDEQHDLMRCLNFSDTVPGEPSDLRIGEIRILSVCSGGELRLARDSRNPNNPMRALTPEILPKGKPLFATLTVNHYLLDPAKEAKMLGFHHQSKIINGWVAECNKTAAQLIDKEVQFFKRHPFEGKTQMVQWYEGLSNQLKQVSQSGNECLLRIAWGGGWSPKTVTDCFDEPLHMDIRKTLDLNVGRPRIPGPRGNLVKGNSLLPKADSPKSRKLLFENGQPKEPLGWLKLSLLENTN